MIAGFPLDRLIVECNCGRSFPACCRHQFYDGDLHEGEDFPCHDFQLVFTDGACSNNGMVNAKAGLGITLGGGKYSWSIPVDDTIDLRHPRTNQRAELLAAIEGLKKLYDVDHRGYKKCAMRHMSKDAYILVTDSEYVTKGITEWLPAWRVRHPVLSFKSIS